MASFSVWPTLLWQLELREFLGDASRGQASHLSQRSVLQGLAWGVPSTSGLRTCAVRVSGNCHWRASAPGEGAQGALSKPGLETLPMCVPPSQIRFCGESDPLAPPALQTEF